MLEYASIDPNNSYQRRSTRRKLEFGAPVVFGSVERKTSKQTDDLDQAVCKLLEKLEHKSNDIPVLVGPRERNPSRGLVR